MSFRKLVSCLIILSLCLSLCACGSGDEQPAAVLSPEPSPAASVEPVSEEPPVIESTPEPAAAPAEAPATPDPEANEKAITFVDSMDTFMTLTAYGSNRNEALDAAGSEIHRLNALFSIGEEDSEVSAANSTGYAELSEETRTLIEAALAVNEMTGGCFDITVTPLMELWGFTTKEYKVPTEEELEETMQRVGLDKLTLDADLSALTLTDGAQIDLGGIAKGYTSHRVMDIFRENGVSSAIVSLGGNVQALGLKPDGSRWKVGIRLPWADESTLAAIVQIENCAVITSGGYERYFIDEETGKLYIHILDPKTGYPVESDIESVSIISPDGTLADGLSTALYIMGLEKATEFWREHSELFDCIFITSDGKLYATEGIYDYTSSSNPLIKLER